MSRGRNRTRAGRIIAPGGVAWIAALALLGCTRIYGGPGVSPAPDIPWTPPPGAKPHPVATTPGATIPAELLESNARWTLADLVDIALRSSSETRAAWAAARAAAAAYGSRLGDYLPDVNLNAQVGRQQNAAQPDRPSVEQRTYGPAADLTWLLFNFGGRRAKVEETHQALLAADWTHNGVIQDVVLRVEQAYYQHVATRALLAAEESTLTEVRIGLDASEERHRAGLGTIAEVLQARTAVSQVQLIVESLRGGIATTRGALATAMGLPANTEFEAEPLPLELPVQQTETSVEQYLAQAREQRPDLAAARAQVFAADAHVRSVRAEGYPALTAVGSLGRVFRDRPDDFSDTHTAALQLRFPIFTGFSHPCDVLESKADADAARARLQGMEQAVTLQVWTSYYDFKTAKQRLKTSEDLMRSATESHDVALGRYRAGVGTILDLLSAQAALEAARAVQVQARADWCVSLARLAHATGVLGPAADPAVGAATDSGKEERP
jgi:outer membrane protein TolC